MALAQTEEIARRLTAAAPKLDIEIVKFETTGDSDQTGKLLQHGGKGGAFVAEIRKAVISGELQTAMHSLRSGDSSLAEVSATTGYADQAHMTREFRRLTGSTPGIFSFGHRDVRFVQDATLPGR